MKKIVLATQPTDKENQAHSNEENNSTTNDKNQPTDQYKISELETEQWRDSSSKETFQPTGKANELSVSQNFIGSDEKVNSQKKEIMN